MATAPISPHLVRVAAVWGTTVVALRNLGAGQSFDMTSGPNSILPIPDGVGMSDLPVRAAPGGWEVDAKGVVSGILKLRGRDEDPVAFAQSGAPIPIVPGDYGLLQYGQFGIFFQFTTRAQAMSGSWGPELLVALALFSSGVMHVGILGLLRALMTPPPISKPLELVSPEDFAARFGLKRLQAEEPPPVVAEGDKAGGSGVKDPGAQDKKPPGGGQKVAGPEGKLGVNGNQDKTQITGDIRPAKNFGGITEVLQGETGEQIKATLNTISSVSDALAMNSQTVSMGSGSGTSLKGTGGGGGGNGAGVIFGSGTMDTGWGAGKGGGYGAGTGGPGGPGSGGNGRGGSGGGNGTGVGTGSGPGAGFPGGGAPGNSRGGLTPEQIRRVVMAHTGALRACYDSELARNPNLKGGVTMTWNIEPGGAVTSASIASSTIGNPRVEGCIQRQVKAWKFPTSESPTNVSSYPFKFGIGG
ncbi:hypothetical protein BH09MYX1_BH09MYX1_19140 [soil metagenome]